MNARDELALRFATLPSHPDAWVRDIVLIGDGWVKDGTWSPRLGAWELQRDLFEKRRVKCRLVSASRGLQPLQSL